MRGAKDIEATATVVIPDGIGWENGILQNVSNASIFYQFTDERDALTIKNGLEIKPNERHEICAGHKVKRSSVLAIHGAQGKKELRFAFW